MGTEGLIMNEYIEKVLKEIEKKDGTEKEFLQAVREVYTALEPVIASHPELESIFTRDGVFWPLLSYTTAVGGSLLSIGSLAGYALMRMEDVTLRWYVRHFAGKVLAGWIAGLLVFYICIEYLI